MTIKLNTIEFEFLDSSLSENQKVLRLKLNDVRKENQFVIIEVDNETADEIRDWASEELQKKGFDVNYELTDIGKILEEIIDLFYIK